MRIFVSLLLICSLAFGGNHFSPKGPTAVWDTLGSAGILNSGGVWNIDNKFFTYDGGGLNKNSPFCQGCNVSFGATGSTGPGGAVTVSGTQRINSFTFGYVDSLNYSLSGGELSCVNTSSCTFTANVSGTIGSVISGSKDLIKQGPQTLTLSGVNTYTGNTNVNAGTLEATTNVEAIPGNLIIAAGATGHLNVTGTKTFPNTISGSGTLKVTAGGTAGTVTSLSGNLSGLISLFDIYPSSGGGGKINLTNTTQANTPPIGSTIRLNNVATNGATIFLDKALNYGSNFELYGGTTGETLGQLRVENATVTGPVTLFANSTVGASVNPGTISGVISGPGFGITKQGPEKITLTNNNTYTGATTISGGTLQISSSGNLGLGSYAGAISNSGTFQYSSSSAQTLSGVISGAGTFTKDTSTTSTLILTGANTYTGVTNVNTGTLKLTNTSTSPTFNIASGAVLELDTSGGQRDGGSSQSFNGLGTLRKTGANSIYWAANAGTFALGSGAMIDIQGGQITGGNSRNEVWTSNLSDLNVANGAILSGVEGNIRVDAMTGAGTISSGHPDLVYQNFTFGVDNGGDTFNGVLVDGQNPGNFVKAGGGTQTLTGVNTYTGTTSITGGTLQIGGAGSLNSGSYAGTISISGGATLQYSSSAAQTLSGLISGAGNILKDTSTTSTLSATANNTNTGTVTVNAGTFYCSYPGAVGSAVTVKSGATLSLGENGIANGNIWTAPLTFSTPDIGTNAVLLFNSITGGMPDHRWSGAITLNTPTTFYSTHQARDNYITGDISGAGPLTVRSDGGAWYFSGNNTYSGGTTLSTVTLTGTSASPFGTGTIILGDANTGGANLVLNYNSGGNTISNPITVSSLGSGSVTINQGVQYSILNGLMTLNRATTLSGGGTDRVDVSSKITGPVGTLTINATPRLTMTNSSGNTSDFTGNVLISSGILQLNSIYTMPATADITVNASGELRLNSGVGTTLTIDALNGSGSVNGNTGGGNYSKTLSVGNNGGTGNYSGVLSNGAGTDIFAFTKAGAGQQTLSGANTYTGATTVTGGTLNFSPANTSFGSTSGTTISGGGQVTLNNGAAGFNYTKNWVFSGLGGTIWFSQPGGAVNFTVSGTITLNGPGTILGNKLQTTTINGAISGGSSLTFSSPGYNNNWVLNGNNTYTGGTIINTASVVRCGSQNCLGTGTVTVNAGGFLNCQNWEITNGIIDNGGTIQNCRRTYLANGNFTAPTGVTSIQYLVVAGGGGGGGRGGANVSGAGGGGGGFLTGTVAVVPGNNYAITVGAGGAQSIDNFPTRGGNSSIGALIVATGGGGGGAGGGSGNQGGSGGSGGGSVGNSLAGGAGTAGQGFIGGRGSSTNVGANVIGAGGGGGAGGAGGTGLTGPGNAPGGAGLASSFSGAAVTYSAGGTGGDYPSSTSGASGVANTGDGGDGAGGNGLANGGSGGSGIVIILPY